MKIIQFSLILLLESALLLVTLPRLGLAIGQLPELLKYLTYFTAFNALLTIFLNQLISNFFTKKLFNSLLTITLFIALAISLQFVRTVLPAIAFPVLLYIGCFKALLIRYQDNLKLSPWFNLGQQTAIIYLGAIIIGTSWPILTLFYSLALGAAFAIYPLIFKKNSTRELSVIALACPTILAFLSFIEWLPLNYALTWIAGGIILFGWTNNRSNIFIRNSLIIFPCLILMITLLIES